MPVVCLGSAFTNVIYRHRCSNVSGTRTERGEGVVARGRASRRGDKIRGAQYHPDAMGGLFKSFIIRPVPIPPLSAISSVN